VAMLMEQGALRHAREVLENQDATPSQPHTALAQSEAGARH